MSEFHGTSDILGTGSRPREAVCYACYRVNLSQGQFRFEALKVRYRIESAWSIDDTWLPGVRMEFATEGVIIEGPTYASGQSAPTRFIGKSYQFFVGRIGWCLSAPSFEVPTYADVAETHLVLSGVFEMHSDFSLERDHFLGMVAVMPFVEEV